MDTTESVGGMRIHNMGLVQKRQNLIYLGFFTGGSGVLMLTAGGVVDRMR
jgi:hypothetical protein